MPTRRGPDPDSAGDSTGATFCLEAGHLDVLWLALGLPLLSILLRMIQHRYWTQLGGVVAATVIVIALWNSLDDSNSLIPTLNFPRAASYLALVLPAIGIGVLILRARSDRKIRQAVGIVWDLANYWSRWYHPWASPPYSEIAIPELVDRIDARDVGEEHIVISAHSQGAVISLPVIQRVTETAGLAFLSYGNLIGTVYRHLFPQYFTAASVAAINESLDGQWRNLYRATDPLGDAIEGVELTDSIPSLPAGFQKPLTHSHYQYNPEYQARLKELTGE